MTAASVFRFSADEDPDLDPAEAMRLVAGPVEVRALEGGMPQFEIYGMVLPAVAIASVFSTPIVVEKLARTDIDDVTFSLTVPGGGRLHCRSGNDEVSIGDGDVLVRSEENEYRAVVSEPTRWYVVRISRATINPLLDRIAPLSLACVSRAVPSTALLRYYVEGLVRGGEVASAGLEWVVANHIRDLAALIIGADREARHLANVGGVMAERLLAAKRLVAGNLHAPDVSDVAVAAELGLSPSYIRKLFVGDGGFYAYLTRERLAHAYRLLTSPTHRHLKIIEIAYMCGFTSLSTFNRQFKARYEATPSDIRQSPGDTGRRSDRRTA